MLAAAAEGLAVGMMCHLLLDCNRLFGYACH
jgi:hypothetical protein